MWRDFLFSFHYSFDVKSRRAKVFTFAILSLLLTACGGAKQEASSSQCFIATVGNDQARFQFDAPLLDGKPVSGTLEYLFAQKDQSWGIFKGTLKDSSLNINYQYSSEGVVSYRDITYKERDGNLVGEGFTFAPSNECAFTKSEYLWKKLDVTHVKADTFHDPETGYYARLRFEFPNSKKDMKIRCIGSVSTSDGIEIARWINIGFLGTGNIKSWNMATNIMPEEVSQVSKGDVTCQYS
jgi:hypothetical protein